MSSLLIYQVVPDATGHCFWFTSQDVSLPTETSQAKQKARKQAIRRPCLCRRTEYLGRTLDSLANLPGLDKVTVYVSQDGHDIAVGDLVQQYGQGSLAPPRTSFFDHWQRDRVPQLGPDQARHAKLACVSAYISF